MTADPTRIEPLKPCPFCGTQPFERTTGFSQSFWIKCEFCVICGPPFNNPQAAREWWNRRPSPASPVEPGTGGVRPTLSETEAREMVHAILREAYEANGRQPLDPRDDCGPGCNAFATAFASVFASHAATVGRLEAMVFEQVARGDAAVSRAAHAEATVDRLTSELAEARRELAVSDEGGRNAMRALLDMIDQRDTARTSLEAAVGLLLRKAQVAHGHADGPRPNLCWECDATAFLAPQPLPDRAAPAGTTGKPPNQGEDK